MHSPSPSSFEARTAAPADWLREELMAAREGALRVTFQAPRVSTLEWIDACPDLSFVWRGGDGALHVGLGVGQEWTATGTNRFREIRDGASRWLAALESRAEPGIHPVPARAFGGFAFRPEAPKEAHWAAFGAARFVSPRFEYVLGPAAATLTVLFDPRRGDGVDRTVARVHALLTTLRSAAQRGAPGATSSESMTATDLGREEWRALVSAALTELLTGRTQKLVVARASRRELPHVISPGSTLTELERAYPACTKFAFRFDEAIFLGATPERLIEKSGTRIATEALAGSAAGGSADAARALLASDKERIEHAPVLEAILAAMGPLCSELHAPPEPSVRELRDLLHLRTPIHGVLRESVHVLDLVERLHPTPAVGGVPTANALDWLHRHESLERGWYAGPVGWFDGAGDGQFDVALRAGMIAGRTATLYAGAGIVGDSLADQEYEETRLKLSALGSALRTRAD